MMHPSRTFALKGYDTAIEMATAMFTRSWTLCSGFYLNSAPTIVWLNDAFSEDGAQEYAVYRLRTPFDGQWQIDGGHVQIESITVSWLASTERLVYLINTAVRGEFTEEYGVDTLLLEHHTHHDACRHCM